jgi:hypothetical protein
VEHELLFINGDGFAALVVPTVRALAAGPEHPLAHACSCSCRFGSFVFVVVVDCIGCALESLEDRRFERDFIRPRIDSEWLSVSFWE